MALTSGARVGPYEVVSPLGTGGMGEVYRARDTRLERLVALKILPASGASPRQIERFHREARAISRVEHRHICTLHDIGQHDGLVFLVMELLDGETLATRLEQARMPLERALLIGAEIAEALDAAHRRGLIHRDLKPSNVMLTRSGVKLLDFGIAKLREVEIDPEAPSPTSTLALTDEGTVVGTLPHGAGAGRRQRRGWPHGHLRARRGALRSDHGTTSVKWGDARESGRRDSDVRSAARVVA